MSASFGKREREKKQQERAAQKRQRRQDRSAQSETDTATEQPDDAALMERFRVLSEAFDSGAVNREAYEAERRAIFTELGLADTLD